MREKMGRGLDKIALRRKIEHEARLPDPGELLGGEVQHRFARQNLACVQAKARPRGIMRGEAAGRLRRDRVRVRRVGHLHAERPLDLDARHAARTQQLRRRAGAIDDRRFKPERGRAAVEQSVDLLGKTFTLTRGTITFDSSAKLDPVLDIVAEASAAEITAQVNIGGFASAPTVTLSSTPVVPQDEILSRVLFNRGVGQITAGEGLQLAAAAATLAGGGPGVLDRLRGGLGLDWFKFGSGPTGPATSTLNPRAASGSATGGTALSAGKYIAPGVSVGVSQGLSPPTSKVTVEIEVRPHLTVGGEAGQSGSTGIGLNYNYDY